MEYALAKVQGEDGIILSGRFTYDDGGRFHALLADWDFAARPVLPLDLRYLTFIDSAAIGMLFILAGRCREAGGHVAVANAQPQVLRTLRHAALDTWFEFR
ncbi:STAS domain-containing protein [Azospirillum thermophilum]|uniref:Anti-sigma factor antagonist n=1 Tax=Azospirillum thermophilum TaxID=2202148 RepID=A0A2S2CQ26_9PROT|nr:STAS domain-containing protein [Azospirillum thermophilum]AWK86417.1 anti-sigma factor antagonist [Azospirillum thermophilum]